VIIGHKPLSDPDIQKTIFDFLKCMDPATVAIEAWSGQDYFASFLNWIQSSTTQKLQGLDRFACHAYCAGTYDGIQAFIHRHVTTRRVRFSRAEFVGSKIICNNAQANWCYLEDAPLKIGDAVVLSVPFAGNGGYHPHYEMFLNECSALEIPVLLDLAYFGISTEMHFDLTHSCITDLVWSLSKPMSAQLRLGMRMTRQYQDDVVQALSDSKTYNRIAVSIASKLLDQFSHDWLIQRYRPKQIEICKSLGIQPTPTVTLALGDPVKHNEFWREGYNRICITDEIYKTI
jgi:hypothetical protein